MSRPTRKPEPDFVELAQEFLAEIANDFPEDLDAVIEWLARLSRSKDPLHELTKYRFPVVGVRKFVEDPSYMNAPKVLWPRVMRELEEMNSGKYVESVLTGGIGVAKTTIALYCQAYQLYLMSCLRNPHEEFNLDPASEIVIVFQSLNANLAKSVDYERFRAMISSAPYFKRHFRFEEGTLSQMKFPRRIIVKPVSGQETGAIGQNVIGGIIDEVDFMAVVEKSKASRDGSVYDQAVQNYNAIARRRESRFMQLGELPGMLCLVSSKNYPGGLTDRKVEEAGANHRIFVYDKRLWDIDPDRFCGDKFRVFVGDETRKPRILREDEIVAERDERLVVAVPVEYEHQFNNDLVKSIRDIAGYSTQALHPFILNTDAVAECFGVAPSIASREECDFEHTKLQLFPKRIQNPGEPRFAHVDLSISKDSAGVCVGHIPGFKHMNRGDFQETLPIIQYDMILEIRPPKGGEIEFENIRRLLYVMRDKLMVPIKWVSFDSFQSTDSMQILAQQGFIVGYQSMDTDTAAYDLTKQALYDRRVKAPAHKKVQFELCTLEFDAKKRKIDHKPQGSKDVSDALAGVAIGLTMRRELWLRHNVPTSRIPESLNKITSKHSVTAKEKQPPKRYIDVVREARGVAPVAEVHDE